MSQFKPYPAYKDSGVEWLGDVPSSWEVKPLKWLLTHNEGGVWGDDPESLDNTIVLRSTDQTVNGRWKITDPALRTLSAKDRASALLVTGDLVVTKSSGSSLHIGKTTLVSSEIAELGCCYGNFMQRLRTSQSFIPKLAWYFMNNGLARLQLDMLSNSTTGLANLNSTLIGEIIVPVSSVAEQIQITLFLDHETARIDGLIEEQKRLIELLREKRQAVISHAVTKGLDASVPMKDSGVEWLGQIPARWQAGALRWYATIQGGVAKGKDYKGLETISMPYLRVANVQNGFVDLNEVKEIQVLESEVERYSLRAGDVLMNEGGDNDKLGRGAVWQGQIEPCLHQNHIFAIRPNQSLKAEWLTIFTQSDQARTYFFLNSKQSTNLASISASNVMNMLIPLPPISEQQAIVMYLTKHQEQHDELTDIAITTVQLLQERRSALISAAVTGKIDVRDWQPPADNSAPSAAAQKTCLEAV